MKQVIISSFKYGATDIYSLRKVGNEFFVFKNNKLYNMLRFKEKTNGVKFFDNLKLNFYGDKVE